MSTALTAGGLAVSLAATGVYVWHWYKAGRNPRDLMPFAGSYVLGGLSTMCAGVLGVAAGWTALLDNGLGKHAVTSASGGTTATMNQAAPGALTTGGHIVAFLFAVGFVVAWKAANKAVKKKLWWGWFCGATMTLTVGVAGLFLHVAGVANGIGDSGYAWFNGGSA